MKKRVIALLLVLLLILSSLPASVFAVSPWKNAAGWRQNEDGSVTHMSGTASISPTENIRNKNGFTLSFDLQIDSADDEMFSTVYRLSANNSEDYFYMRIKKSHGNWCAELQFYNGSWTTLTCKEGASGEWVSGLENTIHVTLAHRAGSKEFTIDIGTPYAGIVRGDVYTPAMDAFLAVRLLSLEVTTDNPQTDIFTLKNYTVTENTGSGSDIPVPEPTVFDVAKDLTVTGKTGDTLVLSLQNGGKALAAGDFMLCYDTSLLSLADATACNAADLLSMSGSSGRDIVSFAGLSGSSENDFAEIRFTLLQKLSNEPVRIIGKNLRSSAFAVLSDPDAYRARLSLQPCV